ncbi:putative serine/threonine-protein kinase [Podospora aff. communis PSN243]|uniref:Serine/threonine-protein kinase n=1 Tax=Podospora aff. communis PSN243 TaxID=3040156 RepID=A0AAV9GHZ4_9PEZI|nr:putative serine/threonine-protein kinase [Podospora aff. communis PSN243]
MEEDLSVLVQNAWLETEFHLPEYVLHRCYDRTSKSPEAQTPFEEIWDVREKIGQGGYGSVHRLECRNPRPTIPAVRAVKQMTKTQSGDPQWSYRAELLAMIKFSQPEFDPHFVRTFGWFDDAATVYIAMEYLPHGDLFHHTQHMPPFSELEASKVVRQLIQGVQYMHDNGFAHRDLKPHNILIASTAPSWRVKIADFGISKRSVQGGTQLRTMIGTKGYQAPEVLGLVTDDSAADTQAMRYTVSVDIWAVGIIALELLVKRRIFPSMWDLGDFFHGRRPLDLSRKEAEELSSECCAFVKSLLELDPALRPTAAAVLAHPWLSQAVPEPQDTEMADADDVSDSLQSTQGPGTPRTVADNTRTTRSSTPRTGTSGKSKNNTKGPRDEVIDKALEKKFQGLYLDSILLVPKFRALAFDTTRYYILRSNNATDVETSAAHSTWTSSEIVNKRLNRNFLESGGQVVLFFSVVLSRKFCGIAQMTSTLDWENTDPHWVEDVWRGRFSITWLTHTEISFDLVKHVPVKESTPGFRAIACHDGTEISPGSAFELLRVYSAEERRQMRLGPRS